jgi:hypothetical protein
LSLQAAMQKAKDDWTKALLTPELQDAVSEFKKKYQSAKQAFEEAHNKALSSSTSSSATPQTGTSFLPLAQSVLLFCVVCLRMSCSAVLCFFCVSSFLSFLLSVLCFS